MRTTAIAIFLGLLALAAAGSASAQTFAQGFQCSGPDPVACVRDVNAKDASGYTLLANVLFAPRSEIAVQASSTAIEMERFAVIVTGHGLLFVPTVVLVPRGARHAIIVQAEAIGLCENYGLNNQTPLCSNPRQALIDIARRLAARFAD